MAQRWAGDPRAAGTGPTSPAVVPVPPEVPEAVVEEDFAAFYRRELPRLVTLAAAIAGSSQAEEIAQEALLRAHRQWGRIARFDKPGAWVRRVAINLSTSARRRRGAETRALARSADRRVLAIPPPEIDGFWQLVRQLPPRQAAAVALHYLDDLSIAEIAVALDCAEGTAKAHLYKARHTLAAHLAAEESER